MLAAGELTDAQGGYRGLPAELIDAEHRGSSDIDPLAAARRLRRLVRKIPATAWTDALLPREKFLAGKTPDLAPERYLAAALDEQLSQSLRQLCGRAAALEYARLWFTRALKNTRPGQLTIRLEGGRQFRL